jgi:hypothetical protein
LWPFSSVKTWKFGCFIGIFEFHGSGADFFQRFWTTSD